MNDNLTEIVVNLQPQLLEQIDELTNDRENAIIEGLKLWIAAQSNQDLQKSAAVRKQRHDRDEAGWLV